MSAWLPLHTTLMNMTVDYIPSPITAQKYRTNVIYSGPLKNNSNVACIRNCDVNGIMTMHIAKMLPTLQKGKFIGFGRVFSGTIKSGQEVYIMGPSLVHLVLQASWIPRFRTPLSFWQ